MDADPSQLNHGLEIHPALCVQHESQWDCQPVRTRQHPAVSGVVPFQRPGGILQTGIEPHQSRDAADRAVYLADLF